MKTLNFILQRRAMPGQLSQLIRYRTKRGGWTVFLSKARHYETRAEAETANARLKDEIIEV